MNTTTTATPITTATTETTASTVASAAAVFIGKSLIGIIAASITTVATSKLLKTGASQKAYEEAIKEFTAK
jgi:hypothetical protein